MRIFSEVQTNTIVYSIYSRNETVQTLSLDEVVDFYGQGKQIEAKVEPLVAVYFVETEEGQPLKEFLDLDKALCALEFAKSQRNP